MDGKDLKQIGELIDAKLDQRMDKLEGRLLEWKSEIIDAVDIMSKEIRDEREFREIGSHQILLNTRRIEGLEKKVFGAVRSEV